MYGIIVLYAYVFSCLEQYNYKLRVSVLQSFNKNLETTARDCRVFPRKREKTETLENFFLRKGEDYLF